MALQRPSSEYQYGEVPVLQGGQRCERCDGPLAQHWDSAAAHDGAEVVLGTMLEGIPDEEARTFAEDEGEALVAAVDAGRGAASA